MPIPMVTEHCIPVDAGAVQLVVESRHLTNAIIADTYAGDVDQGVAFDDFGASLHVCGTADGLEHLRFDCFENEPHYHYVRNADGGNLICRIDQYAEGDPIDWTLNRLRERLPEMLEFAGVPELADATRANHEKVLAVIDEVAELLGKARVQALADRSARA
jgi:hypothetical protein